MVAAPRIQTRHKTTGRRRAAGWLTGLLGAALLAGCQPKEGRTDVQERVLMHNDFEELGSWHGDRPAALVTEKAHSGRYAMRVDAVAPYSPAYRVPLGELARHRPRRLTLSAWVWVPTPSDDAMLVVAITHPNDREHPFFTRSVYVADSAPFSMWKKVSRSLELPPDTHAGDELVLYLWHSYAKRPVYMDDVTLSELW